MLTIGGVSQDHDGSHIKGLLINFIHSFWPSLLKIPSFLVEFITPIVKVSPDSEPALLCKVICSFSGGWQNSFWNSRPIKQDGILPVQATNKNRVLSFYTLPEYESWKESLNGETKGWTIKYYKVCSYFSGDLLPC